MSVETRDAGHRQPHQTLSTSHCHVTPLLKLHFSVRGRIIGRDAGVLLSLSRGNMAVGNSRRGHNSVPAPFGSQSHPLQLLLTDESVISTVHDHHTFMYTCPFYRVPQHRRFIEQKACIRRDMTLRAAVLTDTTRVHVTGVSQ